MPGNYVISQNRIYSLNQDFDLKVGDVVYNRKDDIARFYIVTKIYPYIFEVKDARGHFTTFTKNQYKCGEINKKGR